MIISDLQYIETVENAELQGGTGYDDDNGGNGGNGLFISIAGASADALSFGKFAGSFTSAKTVTLPGFAGSSSKAASVSVTPH